MAYSDRIDAVKGEIDALITYANGITSKSDATIGAAVKSLADGYGGGGGLTVLTGTYTFDAQTAIPGDGYHINLGLPKKARLIKLWIDSDTWATITSPSNNRLIQYFITDFFTYKDMAPVRASASALVNAPDDCDIYDAASMYVNTCSASSNGYAATGFPGVQTRTANFSNCSLDSDGFTIARLSTSAQYFYPVTYQWMAIL